MHTSNILITGANGFIGSFLCQTLENRSCNVVRGIRIQANPLQLQNNHENIAVVNYPEIGPDTNWDKKLHHIDQIVHLAGRVHITKETERFPLKAFRHVNTIGTQHFAAAAAKQGVKRFVYVSSIGVNGNKTELSPFTESDPPSPHNNYTQSKLEAELVLHAISKETGMELVIIRPPLVYGPGVKANFLTLLHIISRGYPLPLGKINNLRSYISVYNLVDFIVKSLNHSQAAGETFLVSDNEDISTPDLIYLIATHLGRTGRVFSAPDFLFDMFGALTNKTAKINRLRNSLQIDIRKANNLLNWQPSLSLSDGLKKTIMWYKDEAKLK